jgi:voltage-gated potassium channel
MLIREKLFAIIFGTDTKAGQRFDLVLLYVILASVVTVLLESIPQLPESVNEALFFLEWTFTVLFAIEYLLRLWVVPNPWRYALSFWGIIDLISFLPSIFSIFFASSRHLTVIRLVRLLRIFRILKLTRFLTESKVLLTAIKASTYKISIFMLFMMVLVVILGAIMYVIEGGENGYDSIPKSIYWAIITITTVGYGDIVPRTAIGQGLASLVMLVGYAIIAVPTGIVTSELNRASKQNGQKKCDRCHHSNNGDANYCGKCGERLGVKDN